jgi:hypothetical protein
MTNRPVIEWTPTKAQRLRGAIAVARKNGQDTFMFDGHEFVVRYAEYLLEYINMQFAKQRKKA